MLFGSSCGDGNIHIINSISDAEAIYQEIVTWRQVLPGVPHHKLGQMEHILNEGHFQQFGPTIVKKGKVASLERLCHMTGLGGARPAFTFAQHTGTVLQCEASQLEHTEMCPK